MTANRDAPPGHWLAVGALALFIAIANGLTFGDSRSNQSVYLIEGLRRVHPDLWANDWWATQTTQYHVVFNWLVELLARLGGLAWGLAALNVACVALLVVLAWLLLRDLRPPAALATFGLLAVVFFVGDESESAGWTYLYTRALQPSTIGAVALIGGALAFLRQRFMLSGLCVAVAGAMHANYLIAGGLLFGLAHLLLGWRDLVPRMFRQQLLPVMVLAIHAPLILEVAGIDLSAAVRAEASALLVKLQHYHYLPATFGDELLAPAGWLLIAAAVAVPVSRATPYAATLPPLLLALAVLLLANMVFASFLYVDAIARMVLTRLAPTLALLCQIAAAAAVAHRLTGSLPPLSRWRLALIGVGLLCFIGHVQLDDRELMGSPIGLAVTAALVVYLALPPGGWIRRNVEAVWSLRPLRIAAPLAAVVAMTMWLNLEHPRYGLVVEDWMKRRAEGQTLTWIRANTDPTAVFLTPPEIDRFRLFAERAIVADWKAVPHRPDEFLLWYGRIRDIANDPAALSDLAFREGYRTHDADGLTRVARTYGADHVMTRVDRQAVPAGGRELFTNGIYAVYRLDDD